MDIEALDQLFIESGLPGGALEFLERPFVFFYGENGNTNVIVGRIDWITLERKENHILFYINAKKIEGYPINYMAYYSDGGFAIFTDEEEPKIFPGNVMFFLKNDEELEPEAVEC